MGGNGSGDGGNGPEGGPPGSGDGGNGPVGGEDGPGGAGLGGILSRLARSMGPGGVELGGDNVRFEQAPEKGLEVRIILLDDAGETTSVASMFSPRDEQPPAQPAAVPFVRGAALRVIEDHVRGVLLAMWMLDGPAAPEPEAALASVLRGSREDGWRLETAAGDGPYRLVRGDRVRRVESMTGHTGPVISLSEKRSVPDVEISEPRS